MQSAASPGPSQAVWNRQSACQYMDNFHPSASQNPYMVRQQGFIHTSLPSQGPPSCNGQHLATENYPLTPGNVFHTCFFHFYFCKRYYLFSLRCTVVNIFLQSLTSQCSSPVLPEGQPACHPRGNFQLTTVPASHPRGNFQLTTASASACHQHLIRQQQGVVHSRGDLPDLIWVDDFTGLVDLLRDEGPSSSSANSE